MHRPTEEEVEEANCVLDDKVIHGVVEQEAPVSIWPDICRGGSTYNLRRIEAQDDKWVHDRDLGLHCGWIQAQGPDG